jgi:hypothetical protein
MTTTIEDWLNDLRLLPDDEVIRHRNWGFTIYRTDYRPSSDQQWQRLLQTIQTCAYEGALSATESSEDKSDFQHLWSLFRLDARSDPTLANLDMDHLRQLYNTSEGGQLMNPDFKLHRVFLFADGEVLLDTAASVVKCVDADYRAEDHVPRNKRVGGQRYFGWIRMRANSVAELWVQLGVFELSSIAPGTIGGCQLVVWDGDQ